MDVSFGQKQLLNGELLNFQDAQGDLSIQWIQQPGILYTVIVYDQNAPSANNSINSPYIHLLIVNNSLDYPGDVVVNYENPSPPAGSGPHWYVVDIYTQQNVIQVEFKLNDRKRFPVKQFVYNYGLVLYQRFLFRVARGGLNQKIGQLNEPLYTFDDPPMNQQVDPPSGQDLGWQKHPVVVAESGDTPDDKYCRCIVDVAANNAPQCNTQRSWFQQVGGKQCYNPYAVCHSSVKGEGSPRCDYRLSELNDSELVGYASLNRVTVPQPYNREQTISNIEQWKSTKGYL